MIAVFNPGVPGDLLQACAAAILVRYDELLLGINQVRIPYLLFIRAGDLAISHALSVEAMSNGPKRIAPLYGGDLDGPRLSLRSVCRRHRCVELGGRGHLHRRLTLALAVRSDR